MHSLILRTSKILCQERDFLFLSVFSILKQKLWVNLAMAWCMHNYAKHKSKEEEEEEEAPFG